MKQTPLYSLHLEQQAQIVDFAGYALPVRYPAGILQEHLHTRTKAGLFDVSHMGQITLKNKDALQKLEAVTPTDLQSLTPFQSCYTVLLNEEGGIVDDMIVTNAGETVELVVNGATKHQDLAYLQKHLDTDIISHFDSRGLMALQGPLAADILKPHVATDDLYFMEAKQGKIAGINCWISRTGYTGEDGFEISCDRSKLESVARALLEDPRLMMIGLGARDSLRLEAGLCLYGHDIDGSTSPVEANLNFVISKSRREKVSFPGAARILKELEQGPSRLRVGFLPEGRAPLREGVELFKDTHRTGKVTSGGFSPSLERPLAMGYVEPKYGQAGTRLTGILRGREVPVEVAPLPFIKPRYRRKLKGAA